MSDLQVFNFNNATIRTVELNGEICFVAKDVCDALEIINNADTLKRVDEDDIENFYVTDSIGRQQLTKIVNESGLYSIILQSNKQEAKTFKKWITSEVLPSIRKTGGYIVAKQDDTPEEVLARAVLVANDTINRLNEQKRIAEQQRDEAIKTKTYISDKKTATAMATASKLSKENTKLKNELGHGKEFATIIAVENKTKIKNVYKWRPLTKYCRDNLLEVQKVIDDRYGEVNSYPAQAWLAVYNINIEEMF